MSYLTLCYLMFLYTQESYVHALMSYIFIPHYIIYTVIMLSLNRRALVEKAMTSDLMLF